jgi:hypothetical protein
MRRRRHREQNKKSLADLITGLGAAAGLTGILNGAVNAIQPVSGGNTLGDNVVSGLSGLASLVGVIGLVAEAPVLVTGAAVAGAVLGAYTVGRDIYNIYESPEGVTWESGLKLGFDALGTVTSLFGAQAVGSGLVGQVTGALENIGGNGVSGALMQSAGFIANAGALTLGAIGLFEQAHSESSQATPPQQVGLLDGIVNVTNAEGPILSGLSGIYLIDPNTYTQFNQIADSSGNYTITVPLGIQGLNYSGMMLQPYDPISGDYTGSSVTINLSGLTPTSPIIDPTPISAACNDTDAGDPDSDDPDCD